MKFKSRISYDYYCIKFYNALPNNTKSGPLKTNLAKGIPRDYCMIAHK